MMILNPYVTFNIVLNWLNIPIDREKLEKAIDFADIKNVRKEEAKNGKAIRRRWNIEPATRFTSEEGKTWLYDVLGPNEREE